MCSGPTWVILSRSYQYFSHRSEKKIVGIWGGLTNQPYIRKSTCDTPLEGSRIELLGVLVFKIIKADLQKWWRPNETPVHTLLCMEVELVGANWVPLHYYHFNLFCWRTMWYFSPGFFEAPWVEKWSKPFFWGLTTKVTTNMNGMVFPKPVPVMTTVSEQKRMASVMSSCYSYEAEPRCSLNIVFNFSVTFSRLYLIFCMLPCIFEWFFSDQRLEALWQFGQTCEVERGRWWLAKGS